MKLKKLLAGVLSATMVATMIPASMAFSSVSAEVPTNGLVLQLTYDNQSMANSVNGSLGTPIKGFSSQPDDGNSENFTFWEIGGTPVKYSQNQTNATEGYYLTVGERSSDYHLSSLITSGDSNGIYHSAYTTISFWVKDASSGNIFGHDNFAIYAENNTITYLQDNEVSASINLGDAGWHMVTLTNNNGTYQFYIDGVASGTSFTGKSIIFSDAGAENNNQYGYLYGGGLIPSAHNGENWNYHGSVDNYYVYSVALNASEVWNLYEATKVTDTEIAPYESTFTEVSYDLTDSSVQTQWTASYSDSNTGSIQATADGVTIKGGYRDNTGNNKVEANYSIENPLKGKAINGFTIAVDVTMTGNFINDHESFFSFSNQRNPRENAGSYLSVSGSGNDVHLNDWLGNYIDPVNTDACIESNTVTSYVISITADNQVSIYVNGELKTKVDCNNVNPTYGDPANLVFYVNEYTYFGFGATTNWGQADMTVRSVSFYDKAVTPDEITAKSIADTLDVHMLGRQLGTTGDNNPGVRFVAGVDKSVVENDAVQAVGWLSQTGEQVGEEAVSSPLYNVTDASVFGSEEDAYAFTLISTDATADQSVAVLPCVKVNGYWFAYTGKSGGYNGNVSKDVAVQVDANDVFAASPVVA